MYISCLEDETDIDIDIAQPILTQTHSYVQLEVAALSVSRDPLKEIPQTLL